MDRLDKRIERIVKYHNNGYENDPFISALCHTFEYTEFENLWTLYWNKINTKNVSSIPQYLKNSIFSHNFEKGFLRLLVLEDFKNYLLQQGIK